ncbi:DUF3137 domain-containing protein [Butyrivibrio proteoclasticus]|uniref:DUF3137 domain-containing protein n=1 Tax=Butyrivibrio proteoclasticus TaxID=43305 RepID=UPI0004789675|nr:DUF3137 domain-containing protein [Butyrivibrio proteoclasticus]
MSSDYNEYNGISGNSADIGGIKGKLALAKFLRIVGFVSPFIVIPFMLVYHTFLLIIPVVAIGVLLLFIGLKIKNSAMDEYGKTIVEPMARQVFPNAEFTYNEKYITLDSYFDLGLITRDDDEYVTNHLVSNDEHELENFSLLCEHTDTDSDGNSSTVVTFRGTVVKYKTPTNIQGVVRVIASKPLNLLVVKKETTFVRKNTPITPEKIETGSVTFDENFEVFASDQHTGFYVLNAYVIEKLQAFRAKYGTFALTITADTLYVSFNQKDKFIFVPSKISDIGDNPFLEARNNLNELIESLNDIAFAISKSTERERTI